MSTLVNLDHIVSMIDCQDLFPVQPYLNKREVFGRQPEFTDLLIFPHEVSPLDPERKRLGRVSGDPDNRVILSVDPNIAFEEILVPALGDGLGDQTAVGTEVLLSKQVEFIIRRFDRAVAMSASRGRL